MLKMSQWSHLLFKWVTQMERRSLAKFWNGQICWILHQNSVVGNAKRVLAIFNQSAILEMCPRVIAHLNYQVAMKKRERWSSKLWIAFLMTRKCPSSVPDVTGEGGRIMNDWCLVLCERPKLFSDAVFYQTTPVSHSHDRHVFLANVAHEHHMYLNCHQGSWIHRGKSTEHLPGYSHIRLCRFAALYVDIWLSQLFPSIKRIAIIPPVLPLLEDKSEA